MKLSQFNNNFTINSQNQIESENNIDKYQIGNVIGKGSYAVVKLGIKKQNNQKFAIKIYEKYKLQDPQKKRNVQREIQLLEKLDHPNIIKLEEVISNYKSINLVMEYAGQISLLQELKSKENRRMEEGECKKVFRQIIESINYLHESNIIHRDIKLENIMLIKSQIKLIDFGFAVQLKDSEYKIKTFCGTPCYMAPEMVKRENTFKGQPVDCWALGVLLFVLLVGHFPFKNTKQLNQNQAQQEQALFKQILNNQVIYPSYLSKNVVNLMQSIFVTNPEFRFKSKQILNHQWLLS